MRHSSHSIALDFYGHSAAGRLLNLRLQVFVLSVFASVSILHLMMSHAFLQICFQTVSKHKPKKNMKKHRRFSALKNASPLHLKNLTNYLQCRTLLSLSLTMSKLHPAWLYGIVGWELRTVQINIYIKSRSGSELYPKACKEKTNNNETTTTTTTTTKTTKKTSNKHWTTWKIIQLVGA